MITTVPGQGRDPRAAGRTVDLIERVLAATLATGVNLQVLLHLASIAAPDGRVPHFIRVRVAEKFATDHNLRFADVYDAFTHLEQLGELTYDRGTCEWVLTSLDPNMTVGQPRGPAHHHCRT